MCGIAGIVRADREPIEADALRAMTRVLEHRGPDGEGIWSVPGAGFGHRRLSILDLSDAAAQPMIAGENDAVLTFNGQIYNFVELREQLASLGDSFTSSGDTQVLLHALRRWGVAALSRAHGMFALGFWSARDRSLLLARDRFGKKPLYYALLGDGGADGVIFASEMRAMLQHPAVRADRSIDPVALTQYLLHEYVPAPRSMFAGVRKLAAGEYLVWNDGGRATIEAYYSANVTRRAPRTGLDPSTALTDAVVRATRSRLVADVPVGVFLSGGLDSSFIAACAVRSHPRVRTFSIGFDDPSFDESNYARLVAAQLGTDHTEEKLSLGAMLELVPSTLDWIDEPHADSSLIPTTLVARLARKHVKVVLGGDGGDEILAGYPTFQADRIAGRLPRVPGSIAALARRLADAIPASDANFSFGFKARQFAQGLSLPAARRHAAWLAPFAPAEMNQLLARDFDRTHVLRAFDCADRAALGVPDDFDAATAFYLKCYLAEGVLTKVDRATMRTSLEARSPLLDTEVVELCLAFDPNLRLRGNTTKWVMRRALANLLPREIVRRPKKGFGAPVGAWLRGPLESMMREVLSETSLRAGRLFEPRTVSRWIDEHVSQRADHRKALWALMVFEHWRRRWGV